MAKRRPLVPEAREGLDQLKASIMKREGYSVDQNTPDTAKYEVAKELGIPLKEKGNQALTSGDAGKIGGQIGGKMVHELIRMAKSQMK
ncbi:small, acid-soluble spore protein, alpha/beta type [Alkalihalobacillus sp. AL-G]|uniref:small, acid-soluble spore protein, alpha/beta type n=1 Tax=Alkalihalobacillus sp. AL-G TaxID=2926399 RepID=UPI00272ACD91|nr:small, acid-soluble spore protein, alpha/beta type [Alkalihalobacillus sp. AL-G]WLD94260.1 alpha/beta-type small acid-soluble spore protein [Alkalihalobacillus sp. AL-G]